MNRRGFTLLQLMIVVACLAMVAAVLTPLFSRARENICGPSCQSNLKQMGLGILQYAQDYDERMPPVAIGTAPLVWTDEVYPYIKSRQVYLCPQVTVARPSLPTGVYTNDYWLNRKLGSQLTKNIANPALTVLSGDGNDGKDVADGRYTRRLLPLSWVEDDNSPAHRHAGKMNLLFADGHVKAVDPRTIAPLASGGPTFQFR